jgi:hypothetical protein
MNKQDLGNGWFAEVGQEYPVEVWAFSVYHDDENDPDYEAGWWSDRVWLRGFVSHEQAAEALELFLQHEALRHCEVHARGWDEKLEVVELVQVFYRFATRRWSYRLAYAPTGVSGWASYHCGEYGSAVAAIRAGQEQWETLRKLGTGGTRVDPEFSESEDYYG